MAEVHRVDVQSDTVTIIGAGLAGSEAAWQLAERGIPVRLVEMRPTVMTPAHSTALFGELVCSNSFKSEDPTTATGILKAELGLLGSIVLGTARTAQVRAGAALAVDRALFARGITAHLQSHPLVEIVREEMTDLPQGRSIIATGPLTSPGFEATLANLVGDRLSFFDAAAPIVEADSINRDVVFAGSRYGKGGGADYLNAPLDRDQYRLLVEELVSAERVTAQDFETADLFSACRPVEEIARSGADALRFGPLKPVGLTDPRNGARPWAVVQLRPENAHRTAYNLVGFQTNLKFPEQERVFRKIPGLEKVQFLRYGVMHRNTFVDAPRLLTPSLRLRSRPSVWIAGQLSGTEGYLEAAASGLVAALSAAADVRGLREVSLPGSSVFGALLQHATDPATTGYQPMHVNFGIVPPLPRRSAKRERYAAYSDRALRDLQIWIAERSDLEIGEVRTALAGVVSS